MRILHINRNYLSTELHQIMIEHLNELGAQSSVFVPVGQNEVALVKPNDNVCISCCFKSIDRYIFDLKQMKIIRSIEKEFDVKSFDCIHAYTLFTDGNAAMKLAAKFNKPFVVAVRDTDVNDFFGKLFYLRKRGIEIMRAAKKIFFLSESYRKQVFEKYVPIKYYDDLFFKTMVIPNGIDDFWFNHSYDRRDDSVHWPVRLIFAGKVEKRKNVSAIRRAMNVLRDKGIESSLTVVGKIIDDSEFKKIKDDSRISYLPAMSKEKLIEQYRNHDVFVMPSFTETFGLVYAEALTQGLPVVYSKGQGFDNQFGEGEVGFHCLADDAKDIARAIENICSCYAGISKNCSLKSLKFKWCDIVRQYHDVYNEILE